jgi:DNA-binding transcriptional regulator YiaG
MTNDDFKNIRQRLGWSRAEMARRHGADLDVIDAWETGRVSPDSGALNQYRFLLSGVEEASDHVAQAPLAEAKIDAENLAQVTRREILNER